MSIYIIVAILIITLIIIGYKQSKKMKYENLLAKYKDKGIVDKIMRHLIWQGMSKDQLVDSWGKPIEVGTKVFKVKTRETFKYNKIGTNRFGSRVILENDIVVGWEKK